MTRDHFNGCIDNVLFNSRLVPMFSFTQADQKLIDVCGSNGTDRYDVKVGVINKYK